MTSGVIYPQHYAGHMSLRPPLLVPDMMPALRLSYQYRPQPHRWYSGRLATVFLIAEPRLFIRSRPLVFCPITVILDVDHNRCFCHIWLSCFIPGHCHIWSSFQRQISPPSLLFSMCVGRCGFVVVIWRRRANYSSSHCRRSTLSFFLLSGATKRLIHQFYGRK